MSLIDSTYFTGKIHIPSSKYEEVSSVITRYENKIIDDLFGYELGTMVKAYDVSTSPQRIKDIVEGKEFTVPVSYGNYYSPGGSSTLTLKWIGLKNDAKESLIAYWVFYWYLREIESRLTNSGSGKSKRANAKDYGLSHKAAYAWSRLMELYGGYEGESSMSPSCFNFLKNSESSYSEWVFTPKKWNVNRFGI